MNGDISRLKAAVEVTSRAAGRLGMSLIADRGLLDAAVSTAEDVLDADQLRAVDAFVQRFQQLVEHMTHRLYPAVFRREAFGERPPPVRSLMNLYEGANLFPSARDWADRAELRNRLVHEYPLDACDRASTLKAAIEQSSLMLSDLQRALSYINDRGLMEAEGD